MVPSAAVRPSWADIKRLVDDFDRFRQAISQSEPADKAELYRHLRLTMICPL